MLVQLAHDDRIVLTVLVTQTLFSRQNAQKAFPRACDSQALNLNNPSIPYVDFDSLTWRDAVVIETTPKVAIISRGQKQRFASKFSFQERLAVVF